MADEVVRDAMLTRMAMATPGGPLFHYDGPHAFPRIPIRTLPAAEMPAAEMPAAEMPVHDMNLDKFDEGQSFATARKGLMMHSQLMRLLGGWAIEIRRQLDKGHTVVLSAGGVELARIEP